MAKINYETITEKTCEYCKETYRPEGPAQRACSGCQVHIKDIERQVETDEARLRVYGSLEFRGSGSTNIAGKDNVRYKTGRGYFHSVLSKKVKRELRYCQDCGKDLIDANQWGWCAHHIDHDRDNNVEENITLLCKSCHQIEHQVWKNFKVKGATTISKESTPKRGEAVSDLLEPVDCDCCGSLKHKGLSCFNGCDD